MSFDLVAQKNVVVNKLTELCNGRIESRVLAFLLNRCAEVR